MNKTDYIIRESDKLEARLQSTMAELAYMIASLDFAYDEDGLEYEPEILFQVDTVVDNWSDKYLVPILIGLGAVVKTINDMLSKEYAKFGSIAGSQKPVMDTIGFSLQSGTYLDAVAELGSVKTDVKRFLTTAMSTGYNRKQLNDGLKEILSKGGVLDKYFKTYLYDIISQYERMAAKSAADKLGLKHFEYSGTIIEDTRDFCMERSGKVFSVQEAKKWNNLHWRGKIEGVDVMVALGGYNCRHWVSYISEDYFNKRIAEGNEGSNEE